MKITIFGSGYVGLVTGACLAEIGNHVICVDIDSEKIKQLKKNIIPIYESGLEALIRSNQAANRLSFTDDMAEAVAHGLFQFIAVGTPADEDGAADLQYVLAVARSIAENMNEYRVIINKSTVPVGTADKVKSIIKQTLQQRQKTLHFDVASNPEFLKEGSAIADFMKPERIILGTSNHKVTKLLKNLYAPFNRNSDRLITMDIRSAELTKYAANAMLATKISFMNEMANLAERLGADIEQVRQGIGSDSRIGYDFIYAGCGYGGSCFPKDIKALIKTANEVNFYPELLKAVEQVNYHQKQVLFDKIQKFYSGEIKGKVFALWGLAFKPKTDDMREAPSEVLIEALLNAGASIQAYDPEAMNEAAHIYGADNPKLSFCESAELALTNADSLCIVTEWKIFWSPDFDVLKSKLKDSVIFDGRNLYNPEQLKEVGLSYFSIGRSESIN